MGIDIDRPNSLTGKARGLHFKVAGSIPGKCIFLFSLVLSAEKILKNQKIILEFISGATIFFKIFLEASSNFYKIFWALLEALGKKKKKNLWPQKKKKKNLPKKPKKIPKNSTIIWGPFLGPGIFFKIFLTFF